MKPTKQLSDYPQPSVAIDLAILTVAQGGLQVLLMRRNDAEEVGGLWALPGGFVHADKTLDETVLRVMKEKAGLYEAHLEQLGTYGALERDPRGRVISVVYFALTPLQKLVAVSNGRDDLLLARIEVPWRGEEGGPADALSPDGEKLQLAFDHEELLGDVVKRLRGKLDYTPIGFALLERHFTLRDAQEIHEAILGRSLTKPAFRRKLLDRGLIRATGKFETGGAYRPAELYELK
ncbi:NUDIX hydrolase [Denitrobaculum tricleocarpae]|uniref:NUDIX hydrolase n=1 Tax=Denitrobaculum tricleocarpae TaxID=2591009 RepID=A0A545TMK6_9PROT|nr:NUDIX domain-containing protein [Denitrobaculum tricleocarpae]TQV78467.1 NUDIX hydrolase [Denitrobaculum tricleocarpae]